MEVLDRIKVAVKALISLGLAKNQEEIGILLGYTSKSAFSQVLNGKVSLPNDFIDRLCNLDKRLVKMWILNEEGSVLRSKKESKQVYINNNIDLEGNTHMPESISDEKDLYIIELQKDKIKNLEESNLKLRLKIDNLEKELKQEKSNFKGVLDTRVAEISPELSKKEPK